MVNYLNTFCPALAETISPLHSLTRQDQPFVWADIYQHSFAKAKELITCSLCSAYFDVNKEVVLQVDASDTALGGSLLQPNGQGKLQPVAFTSCLMRPNEQRWTQIEKEALALCVACEKWYLWLYGKRITVHTDHQPLETIFKKNIRKGPKKTTKTDNEITAVFC